MKNKFVSLLFVTTLSTPLLFSSCGSTQPQEDHSLKEVSYKDFLKASELATESIYNSVYVSYFDKSETGDKTEINDKYVFVDNAWVHQYGLEKGFRVENYLNSKLDAFLTYIETREDFAKLKFYLSDSLFYISGDIYNQEFEASFNIYGDPLLYKGWAPDVRLDERYYCDVSASYFYENVKVVTAYTIRISDMYFEYDLVDDSYSYSGYNQRVKPFRMIIPDTYNDGVHGEKPVSYVDMLTVHSGSIHRLEIGKNVSNIEWESIDGSFTSQSSLEEVNVDEENEFYSSYGGILYSKDKKTLFRCPNNYYGVALIPVETEIIDDFAFSMCENLSGISFSNNVNKIGALAFAYSGIQDIHIPDLVTYFPPGVFAGCKKLKHANLGSSLVYLTVSTFESCVELSEITISNSLKQISGRFAINCPKLNKINFSGTVNEWNNILLSENWDESFLNNHPVVYCYDGEIELNPIR